MRVIFHVSMAGLLLAGCGGGLDPCENGPRREVLSPDRTWKAVAFTRGCGATGSDSLHVSVLGAGEVLPRAPGNVAVLEGTEALDVRLRWRSARTLEVEHAPEARWHRWEPARGDVRVRYVPAEAR
jgi:hypothetical protein